MGEMDIEKVKRLAQWFRELISRLWRQLKNSKFFLAVIMFSIGASSAIIYYEVKPLYEHISTGYQYSTDFLRIQSYKGSLVPAGEYQDAEPQEVKNSGESVSLENPNSPSVLEILDTIYLLESSRGKNVNCPPNKFNGYGYRQNSKENICYETQEEVRLLVKDWIGDKINRGFSEGEIYCYYNTGKKSDNCNYYLKVKNL